MTRALALVVLLALPQEGPGERVPALSRDLESADARKVYKAIRELAALGEAALPALEARAKESSGRTRDYLDLAADEIRSVKLFPDVPPVKRVTMKATDRNVVELLGELRSKTGAQISLENLMDEEKLPEIPIDVHDVTMLEAFDAICHAGNVSITMESGQFALYPGDYVEMPRFFYGHYLFRLQSFSLLKSVNFRKPATHTFSVVMEMLWDPAAAPCRFNPPRLLEAVDEKGKNLLMPDPPKPEKPEKPEKTEKTPEAAEDAEDMDAASATLKLLPPSPGAEKISLIRGFATLGLPKTRVSLKLDKAAEGEVAKAGDFTVKLGKIDAQQYRIDLELTNPKLKPDAISAMPILTNVILKGGESSQSYVSRSWTDDTLALTVMFQPTRLREVIVLKPGDDPRPKPPTVEKIEVVVVTSVQERRVPFEFRDVKIK